MPSELPRRRGATLLRVIRIASACLAVLVVLLTLAVAALHLGPARRYVLAQVSAQLRAMHILLSADAIRYNLPALSLSLDQVRLSSLDAPSEDPFAVADRVDIDVSLLELIRGRYVVDSARITGLQLRYIVDAQGHSNLPVPPADDTLDEPSELIDFLVKDTVIDGAHVRYDDRAAGVALSLPVDHLVVDGQAVTRRHDIRVTAGPGEVTVDERRIAIDRFTVDADLGRDDVQLRRAELSALASRVTLSGGLSDFKAPEVDITVRADVDAPAVIAAAALDETASGRVRLDATARGRLDALQVVLWSHSDAIAARGLPPASVGVSATYDHAQRIATIGGFELAASWGRVSGSGRVALADGESRIAARLAALDAGAVMAVLDLPYRVASRIDGGFEASMPGVAYLDGSGRASATLTPIGRLGAGVVPVAGRLSATATRGDVRVDLTRVTALASGVSGTIALRGRDELSGTLHVRAAELADVVPAVEAFLGRPRGSLAAVSVAGAIAIDTQLAGTLAAPRVDAVVEAPALRLGTIEAVALAATARATREAVDLDRFDMRWRESIVAARGRVGLAGAQPLSLTASAQGVQIADVLGVAQLDVPAAGVVAAQVTVTGTVARPVGDARLQANDLLAYGEPLGRLSAEAHLEDQRANLETLALDKPQGDQTGQVRASGTYALDTRQYQFELTSKNLTIDQLQLPDGTTVRGALELSATGAGSADDPAAKAAVTGERLVVAGREVGAVTATLALAGRTATVEVESERFATTASAVVAIDAPYAGSADVAVRDLALDLLPLQLDTPLTGRVRARIHAEGQAASPADATATATIDALEARWNDQPITLDGPASIALNDRVVVIDGLRLAARDSTVAVSGRVPLDADAGPGALDVDARLQLATLAAYAPSGLGLSADGAVVIAGRITGTAQRLDPDVTVAIDNGWVLAPQLNAPVAGVQVRARVAGGSVELERASATWGTATFDASGRAPIVMFGPLPFALPDAAEGATFEARVSGLDPALLPGAPAGVSGHVGLTVTAAAATSDPASIDGRITFDALELGFGGLTLAQQRPSAIAVNGGIATIEAFALTGSAGTVEAAGSVSAMGARPIDLTTSGTLDLAAMSVVTDEVQASGPVRFEIRAEGSLAEPRLNGFAEVTGASVAVDEPAPVAIEHLDARIDLAGAQVTLSRLGGTVNGGTLTGSGAVTLGGDDLVEDVALQLAVDDLAFSAPLDLRSVSDLDLRLSRRGEAFVIDGEVTIAEGGLTGDVNFDTGILGVIGRPRGLDLTEERNPLLERVQLDVGVRTESPILIDNNLAKAELTTDVRVLGTPYDLGMSGRMEMLEGSAVTLNERRYEVARGLITFTDDQRITPTFDLQLTTDARHYDITLGVTGEVGDTETTLTSNPSLPEPDIMALLVTGRTLDDMRGEEYEVAREQVLSYLTGRVGSSLGRGLERATGLSEVRVEPNLIANEADPGARLTVGQDLTSGLRLIYSTDLADSSNQIWVAEYDITRRFETRAVRQRDNTYRMEFRHDVRAGGTPEPRRMPRNRPIVSQVDVAVDDGRDADTFRELLKLEPGDAYDFFDIRDGIERIEKALRHEGFLQSRARSTRVVAPEGGRVAVAVRVTRGPRVQVIFDGVEPSGDLRDDIEVRWQRGVFDSQRRGDIADLVRAWLMGDRHLDPRVDVRIDDAGPGARTVHIGVVPGPRFRDVTLVFEGAAGVSPDVLDSIVDDQDLEEELFTDPIVVTELLRRYYREEGYLAARLEEPVATFSGDQARIVVRVTEGPRFMVASLQPTGNAVVPTAALLAEAPLRVGDPFLPAVAERSLDRIRQLYWRRGYNDVRLTYSIDADRDSGQAAVALEVAEGRRSVVASIDVTGTDRTTADLVRGQLEVAAAAPLDVAALGRSRRNLYSTGAYSLVELTRTVSSSTSPEPGADKAIDLQVTVREVQPFQVGYGASFDTERGPGGVFEIANYNSLGHARQIGLNTRYDSQLRQVRLYLSQPMLKRFPLQTTASAYFREERNPLTEVTQAFNVDRLGASLQQERRLANQYVWNYGVRYERARTFDPRPGALRDETTTVTPLTSTFTRETRDDVLDASRGAFVSQAFSYSPSWLGSDSTFVRYYGQYFTYFPLRPPTRERLTNEILRPRLVFASGVRLGLARGLLPFSERFFGGGSTSVRGFAQNGLGPRDAEGLPDGGNATVVLNNELRFPLVGIVDGVGFLDVGGVFPRVSDWSWSELRESAGVGVRLRTPWFLVRGDYGVVLDRRAGERRSRFFFSIGQAF